MAQGAGLVKYWLWWCGWWRRQSYCRIKGLHLQQLELFLLF